MTPLRALLVAAVAFMPSPASAYEGLCRTPDPNPRTAATTLNRLARLDAYIRSAKDGPSERPDMCEEGLGYARGVQLGEHTWITAHGMRLAGIPERVIHGGDVFARPPGRQRPPGYYVSGAKVALAGSDLRSFEPASAGAMREWLERRVSIAEFSEFADGSHSLSGYILGNEHCLAAEVSDGRSSVPRRTLADVNRCHTFKSHLQTINATHWPPLHREMYRRYHGIALSVAASCKAMHDRVTGVGATSALRDNIRARVLACEREALAFEAYASHFLQDAWATGHMFIRWGGPRFATGVEGQVRAWVAGALTGFIHGSRSLFARHDQANMPGPRVAGDPSSAVRWRYPASFPSPRGHQVVFTDSSTHHGGGDLYLLPSTARDNSRDWAISTGGELAVQFGRMRMCVAAGFREVLSRGSLQLVGGRLPPEPRVAAELFSSFPSPDSDACWAARLTNRSMLLGLGSWVDGPGPINPTITPEDLTDPGFLTRQVLQAVIETAGEELPVELSSTVQDRLSRELRTDAVRLSTYFIQQARRDADGTTLSSDGRSNPRLREVFGVRSTDQFVHDIATNRLPYLERADHSAWSDRPQSRARCGHDDQCPSGTYCDRTAVVERDSRTFIEPRCVRHEAAVLRAFRVGETMHWCRSTTRADIDQAIWACSRSSRASCEPCADMVMPLLRNAASEDEYTGFTRQADQRSLCDVIGASNPSAARYAQFTDAGQALRRAEGICRGHPFITLVGRWRAVTRDGRRFEFEATGEAEGEVRFTYAALPPGTKGLRVGALSMEGEFTNFNQTFSGEILLYAPSGKSRRVRVTLTASDDGNRLDGFEYGTRRRRVKLERVGGAP